MMTLNFTKELLDVHHFEINVKDKDSNLSRLALGGRLDDQGNWKSRFNLDKCVAPHLLHLELVAEVRDRVKVEIDGFYMTASTPGRFTPIPDG